MSNLGKSIGNFQANVGKFSADISVIASYIIAGILILTAIGLAIAALIPMRPWNCESNEDLQSDKKSFCNGNEQENSPVCINAKKNLTRCNKKVKQLWLLWFLLLIPLAVLIVFFSKWWKHFVNTNKTAAQVGGTLFELNTLKDFMKN